MVTYNVHKQRPCEATRICRAMRRLGFGRSIVCLQEIPKWTAGRVLKSVGHVVHSSRTKQDEIAGRDGLDCGFLIPTSLSPRVRDEQYGRYWGGIVLDTGPFGHTLFLTVHFIHTQRDNGDTAAVDFLDEAREETVAYWQRCRQKFGQNLSVVTGFDANVTLPAGVPRLTGRAVLPPLPSHKTKMQNQILDWMFTLGVRAANTFGEEDALSELWTCGIKRRLAARSQIDFIGLSADLTGLAKPMSFLDLKSEPALLKKMDHRPVQGDFAWDPSQAFASCATPCRKPRLPKGTFNTDVARDIFRKCIVQPNFLHLGFDQYEGQLFQAARLIFDDEGHNPAQTAAQQSRAYLKQLRRCLRFETDPALRKEAATAMWREIHKLSKISQLKRLKALTRQSRDDLYMPTCLSVDGALTGDRSEWLRGAFEFGRQRFGDTDESVKEQKRMLAGIWSAVRNEQLDGRPLQKLEFWDVLQSRAALKPGSAPGADGVTPDIFLELPFLGVARVHSYFAAKFGSISDCEQ